MRHFFIFLFCFIWSYSLMAQHSITEALPLVSEDVPPQKNFTGKRISLNFQKINIRAVLQLLADFTELNIVLGKQVKGEITLRLNNVPWDQALDLILTTHNLDKRQTGNVLLIDDKLILEKMDHDLMHRDQKLEESAPVHSEWVQINYAKAADVALVIKDQQNSLLSTQGKVSADARTNTLWIQDTRLKMKEIRQLVKRLDVPVKQVLIEARIVEVSKGFSQDLGIHWGVSKAHHSNHLHEKVGPDLQVEKIPATSYTQRLNLDLIATPLAGANPMLAGVALAKLGDNILLDLELSALESEGRAELISSPRLMTTNQQPALIDSGQEIPYQEFSANGTTAVAFKKAVLSLKVTPHITADNKILMKLQINQDTTSAQLFNGAPTILTKEIQTNVLMKNGQTIVLGGIYQQDRRKKMTRVPFLGQLPLVGVLFKNNQIILKNDELIIFITSRIIDYPMIKKTSNRYKFTGV